MIGYLLDCWNLPFPFPWGLTYCQIKEKGPVKTPYSVNNKDKATFNNGPFNCLVFNLLISHRTQLINQPF